MLHTLVLFMPAFVCLVWGLFLSWVSSRTDSFRTLILLIAFTTMYAYADAIHSDPRSPDDVEPLITLVFQFVAPSIIPLAMAYMRRLRRDKASLALISFWFIPPVILLTVGILLHFLAGPENVFALYQSLSHVHKFEIESIGGGALYVYYIFVVIIYRVVLLVQIIWLLIVILTAYWADRVRFRVFFRFLFKGAAIKVIDLQFINLLALLFLFSSKYLFFKDFINNNPLLMVVIALLLTIVVCLFCAVSTLSMKREIVIADFWNCFRYDFSSETRSQYASKIIEEHLKDVDHEALRRLQVSVTDALSLSEARQNLDISAQLPVAPVLPDAEVGSWRDQRLLARFQKLMSEEKLYLQPGLTIVEVADKLNSNKSYVSRMVNGAYGMSFPELLNKLRVDYSQRFIIAHPDARQDRIAAASGFLSASSFNNTFKKVTGLTPKVWESSVMRNEKSLVNS